MRTPLPNADFAQVVVDALGIAWCVALVEPSGRCVMFGEGVTDSPQRFRLPAGTQTLRAGPQGRMVAW